MKNASLGVKGLISALISLVIASPAFAKSENEFHENSHEFSDISMHYNDGSPPSIGLNLVNSRLRSIGVRVSVVDIPQSAIPLLKRSEMRALNPDEHSSLLRIFHLERAQLLAEITAAGRSPAISNGGALQTSEKDVAPYPKIYDMRSLDPHTTRFLKRKFGRLHINSSDSGEGIDEVMTIISGGPYTWFFALEGDVVAKLTFGKVEPYKKAWRISYPGLVPHGGYFDAEHGVVVAFAHGPERFVMRYKNPKATGQASLGNNPWIDFTPDDPELLETAKPLSQY